jgi:hypothetical protein
MKFPKVRGGTSDRTRCHGLASFRSTVSCCCFLLMLQFPILLPNGLLRLAHHARHKQHGAALLHSLHCTARLQVQRASHCQESRKQSNTSRQSLKSAPTTLDSSPWDRAFASVFGSLGLRRPLAVACATAVYAVLTAKSKLGA